MPASKLRSVIGEIVAKLEVIAPELPTTSDASDAAMALMYLRHVAKSLGIGAPKEEDET